MSGKSTHATRGPDRDPFGERIRRPFARRLAVLGQAFEFRGNDARLLELVDHAYRGLPQYRFQRQDAPFRLQLQLQLAPDGNTRGAPPEPRLSGGGGVLVSVIDGDNHAVLDPGNRRGLVSLSTRLLARPYYARYELLEFAVFTLACRGADLVPLHAACIGRAGRGLLLVGASGAGKTTLAALAGLHGFDFVTEDAAFIAPRTRLATGVANFLHLRPDSLRLIDDPRFVAHARRAPMIRRRSGARKYEVDLRQAGFRLAPAPQELVAVVFLEPGHGDDGGPTRLTRRDALARLRAAQPYASTLPQWPTLARSLASLSFHALGRARHPRQSIDALDRLLG